MTGILNDIISRNRAGNGHGPAVAIPSVCSGHGDVLRASLLLAEDCGHPVVIEATSNQVNQFGGYTGLRPADFAASVDRICAENQVDRGRVVLGGDHLGPQVWRHEGSQTAMAKARKMMADYVAAGFTKIHIDCAEPCAGDLPEMTDNLVASRAADLARACEDHAPDETALAYVVGTEVPPPGGARNADLGHAPVPTTGASASATLATHLDIFAQSGLAQAAGRIRGLVIQPGVEFSGTEVHHLPPGDRPDLAAVLAAHPGCVFEAHSTDYQTPAAFARLARLGFAIQKVGPALTYAYRRALYALDHIRSGQRRTDPILPQVMERLMRRNPANWEGHYAQDDPHLSALLHHGLADRIRYYWPQPEAAAAVAALKLDINANSHSPLLYRQYFSDPTLARADALMARGVQRADAFAMAEVQTALRPYFLTTDHGGIGGDG